MKFDGMDERVSERVDQRRVVVIGYGSPIRGDDAVGPLVADHLSQQLDQPQVEIISRHVLTAELAESLRDATLVIFVDAEIQGRTGDVTVRHLLPRTDTASAMAHTLDAEALLGWTQGLYGRSPEAVLVSTPGISFDYANYQLSPAVEAAIGPMAECVRNAIRQHLD